MSPTATTTRAAAKPAAAPTYAYAGKLLRVNLTTGKTWTEAWREADRREYVGGIGLGAKILYEEVGPKVQWDHPDNRLIMATGPLAGLPVWGTGGLTVITRGALTGGATSTQANGFFGAALKYSGYDAIVMQGQAKKLSYLYINDDVVEVRDAAHLAAARTPGRPSRRSRPSTASRATACPSTPSGRRGKTWCASRRSTATTATWPRRTAAAR